MRCHLGREIVAGARPVIDGKLLVQMFRQILPDQAGADIGRAAGRIADEPAYRVVRIIVIGARRSATAQNQHARKGGRESPLNEALHSTPPAVYLLLALAYAASVISNK